MVNEAIKHRIQRLEGDMTQVEANYEALKREIESLEMRFSEHKKGETP